MFALFARYYSNISRADFERDLDAKDCVILLEGEEGIAGFTTASLDDFTFEGRKLTIVFSGDTIVDHRHWGEQALARSWLKQIGRWSGKDSGRELFWFLIVKGHRTYRYLPAFALRYVPSCAGDDQEPALTRLRDALATDRFGDAFDPQRGVIHFDRPRGNLADDWAEPSAREANLPDVAYFLRTNPGYRAGDELACVCSLARENMRPLAKRWFDAGNDDV